MPHELVIQGADGIKRVMTVTCGGIRKSALVGPGIVIPGCCGSCGCKTEVPGCALYSPTGGVLLPRYTVEGVVQLGSNGVQTVVYRTRKVLPGCCCGPLAQQKFRSYFKTLKLCTDGRTYTSYERAEDWDHAAGTKRIREFAQARVPGTSCNDPLVTYINSEQVVPVGLPPSGGNWCLGVLQDDAYFGREDPHRFGTYNAIVGDINEQPGQIATFSGGCNFFSVRTRTIPRNPANGGEYLVWWDAALVPHDGSCDGGPPCIQACCLPDGSCREGLSPLECTALGGLVQPLGIGCYQARCLQPGERDRGRCCNPATGDCFITAPDACMPPNIFAGIGTTCVGNPCPQPLGACCQGLTCSQTTQLACQQAGGSWQGPGTSCQPSPCIVGGACCKRDGTCQQVNSPQACVDLNGIFFPGGDCQTVTCPECCYVDEPERTYTLSGGGETVVLGAMTHCCWERAQYAINGGGVYRLRLNFNPPNCYAQEIYFSFEQQLGGQWQLVKRILNYGQGTGSCGNPAEESFDRINIDPCTSADAVLNLMVGTLAAGGSGTRQTTCSSGTATRTDANSGSTATLNVNVNITGGTACLEGCGTGGRLGPGDVRVINPLVVPDGRGGWERVDGGGRGCSGCGGGVGF